MSKKLFFIITLISLALYCHAQNAYPVEMRYKKIWNYGKIDNVGNECYAYLVAFVFENNSNDTKLLLTDYLSKEGIFFFEESYIGDGYVILRKHIAGLIKPKSKVTIYKIIGIPANYVEKGNNQIKMNFVYMSYKEYESNKYDYLTNEEKRKMRKRLKNAKGESENEFQIHRIALENNIDKRKKYELVLKQKKEIMEDILTCEFDL